MRDHARSIWDAAVAAVRPEPLVRQALMPLGATLDAARRILVVGAGKAGAAMSAAVESTLAKHLDKIEGFVNVPGGSEIPLRKIRLHAARTAGSNHPTAEGVAGAEQILRFLRSAGPDDVALCLLSGGGSALLPAPAPGITLADKQQVTKLLHACGATINEMNAIRKHLSAVKGGRLAEGFAGKALVSLIISDVIGDPLDVIASGPTAPDPTTFADAWNVLQRYQLVDQVPAAVREHLQRGLAGKVPETPKLSPASVRNLVIGNNVKALAAAENHARSLGYQVLNLGSYIEGETKHVAVALAGIARSIRDQGVPVRPPACVLSGGETTVTLCANSGKGGRNQESVLAALQHLGFAGMRNIVALSGGTDGEDGPTDAAGAIADAGTWERAAALKLNAGNFLVRNDAYQFFNATGDLLKTGLTQTNVMDVRVILIDRTSEPRP
jgi:hydroxypyruvate reductase/glycerate 2-kinase